MLYKPSTRLTYYQFMCDLEKAKYQLLLIFRKKIQIITIHGYIFFQIYPCIVN